MEKKQFWPKRKRKKQKGRKGGYIYILLAEEETLRSKYILDLVELNSSFASRPTEYRNGPLEVWFFITVVQWGYSNC